MFGVVVSLERRNETDQCASSSPLFIQGTRHAVTRPRPTNALEPLVV